MPDSAQCITGQVWDAEQERCVDVAGYCGEGTTWVASMETCVPDDDLLVADVVEGPGENDPTFGGTSEHLDVPVIGMRVVVGGSISAAEDKDADGLLEPDYDYYEMSVPEPTLLRITADGVGGASSGFMITSLDGEPASRRYGIGTTSDGAVRDVVLPSAGRYALVASDAMNFVTLPPGPFFGGDGLRYFITIEHLAWPEGEEVTLATDHAEIENTWPREAPASGSMLGFYTMPVDVAPASVGRLVKLSVETAAPAVQPVLVMIDQATRTLLKGDSPASTWGFREAGRVTVIADYVYWFGAADAAHVLEIDDLGMGSLEEARSAVRIDQVGWIEGDEELPRTYFGFIVEEGEVVTMNATTTTGVTLFEVFDQTLTTSHGWFQGQETSPLFESDIRFRASRSGLYVLAVLDFGGAAREGRSLRSIPGHRFNVTTEIRRQVPATVDLTDGTWSTESPEAVTLVDWERFFVIDPVEGDSYSFEVVPSTELRPFATFYDMGSDGPLTATAFLGGAFARRFPTGGLVLLGIADAGLSSGVFDLAITPIEVEDLGTLDSASPVDDFEVVLAEGDVSRFFQVQALTPGRAVLDARPEGDLDVVLVIRNSSLDVIDFTDHASAGRGETASMLVTNAEPAFFEIASAFDEPMVMAGSVGVSIRLTPFTPEIEPNDSHRSAQVLTAGEIVLGDLESAEDQDWYSLNVEGGAVHLDLETHSVTGFIDTRLSVVGSDGATVLAFDDDGGDGMLSHVTLTLTTAGTYYFVVHTRESSIGGAYLLDFVLSPS
jgi:hypothetical protein